MVRHLMLPLIDPSRINFEIEIRIIVCFQSPTMPDLDHTKSLAYYQEILESLEEEYREATSDEKGGVMDKISNMIEVEALKVGATIANAKVRRKVSTFLVL